MKKNELNEIKNKEIKELVDLLSKEKRELTELVLQLKIKKLKNTRQIFHKRRTISQIATIINQKKKKL